MNLESLIKDTLDDVTAMEQEFDNSVRFNYQSKRYRAQHFYSLLLGKSVFAVAEVDPPVLRANNRTDAIEKRLESANKNHKIPLYN